MSGTFSRLNEKTNDGCRYKFRKRGKKKFGKLRPIERELENKELTKEEDKAGEIKTLSEVCGLIRNWLNTSLSHKYRLKGVELYESMQDLRDCIKSLRKIKEHSVLKRLEESLMRSTEGLSMEYEALKQGKEILAELTDLLYGAKDDKNRRKTEEYKEQTTSKKVKESVELLLKESKELSILF